MISQRGLRDGVVDMRLRKHARSIAAILVVARHRRDRDVARVDGSGRGHRRHRADAGHDRRGRRDARARALRHLRAGGGPSSADRARAGRPRGPRQDRARAPDLRGVAAHRLAFPRRAGCRGRGRAGGGRASAGGTGARGGQPSRARARTCAASRSWTKPVSSRATTSRRRKRPSGRAKKRCAPPSSP